VKQILLTAIAMLMPAVALACPVCFGESDSPLAKATNLGIIALLVVVVGVLASFAAFFVYLNRRARLFASTETEKGLGPA
jgi:hypothetical protein